jgi:hypothetical protein
VTALATDGCQQFSRTVKFDHTEAMTVNPAAVGSIGNEALASGLRPLHGPLHLLLPQLLLQMRQLGRGTAGWFARVRHGL